MRNLFHLFFVIILLASCTSTPEVEPYSQENLDKIYSDAVLYLDQKQYEEAADKFLSVEREYPYSDWSEKALLMAAYSFFEAKKYDIAVNQLARYKQLYPNSKDLDYANYLVGLSYYLQVAIIGRDQTNAKLALQSFNIVTDRFPRSEYAADARLKKDLIIDHIAASEMEIGRYYQKKNQHAAAINRFKNVVTKYQTTSHIEEALARYSESYISLGIYTEAQSSAAILGYNYPNSKWYEYIYTQLESAGLSPKEEKDSWIERIWN
jgi:outer membrane protein assembly factor BamD